MNIIDFVVPVIPVAQPRGRATSRGGRSRIYNPEKIKNKKTGKTKLHPIVEFKEQVKIAGLNAYNGPLLEGPLRVDVFCLFPRHKSKIWKTKEMVRYRHTQKPDRDNLDKAVLDALKGVIWQDDDQVCDGRIQKWHAGDEEPFVRVKIMEIPREWRRFNAEVFIDPVDWSMIGE